MTLKSSGSSIDSYVFPFVVSLLIAFVAFSCGVGVDYPSSDLDGHIATIDLFRNAFGEGVLWPFDRFTGFGDDAVPYYSWPLKYLLGIIAFFLGNCGLSDPSQIVMQSTIALACSILPLAMAWCAGQIMADFGSSASWYAKQGGAIGALAWLSLKTCDGFVGYGIATINIGLSYQVLGWVGFLLTIGATCRCFRMSQTKGMLHFGFDPIVCIFVAFLATCHTMSMLAATIIILPFISLRPFYIGTSCVIGGLFALPAIIPTIAAGDRLSQISWMHAWKGVIGPDSIMAVFGYFTQFPVFTWITTAIGASAFFGLFYFFYKWKFISSVQKLFIYGLGILQFSIIMPSILALLPGSSQPYRMHSMVLLCIFCIGVACTSWIISRWLIQIRKGLIFLWMSVVTIGLFANFAAIWPQHSDPDPNTVGACLAKVIPNGSRILVLDGGVGWNRQIQDRWARKYNWMSASGFYHQVTAPVNIRANAVALGMGSETNNIHLAPYLDKNVCIGELQDLGFTHVILKNKGFHEYNHIDFLGLPITTVAGFTVATVPNPHPIIEQVNSPIIAIRTNDIKQWKMLAAWWWGIVSHNESFHVIYSDDLKWPTVDQRFIPSPISDIHLRMSLNMASFWAMNGWNTMCVRFLDSMRSLSDSARINRMSQYASTVHPSISWKNEHTIHLSGLIPGTPYLMRIAHSNRFSTNDGAIYGEFGGFTMVIPNSNSMVIQTNKYDFVIFLAILASSTIIAIILIIFFMYRNVKTKEAIPEGVAM